MRHGDLPVRRNGGGEMILFEHKGYYGSVAFGPEDHVFFGKLEFIRDLVTFETSDAKMLEAAFVEAVEDYLTLRDRG